MSRLVLLSVALVLAPAVASAMIDCRIRSLPPLSYASKPLPAVEWKGLPLAELQRTFRRLAGLPAQAPGAGYCGDPLGFVYPWNGSDVPTIYFPNNVTERCRREVIEHESAHVKGWSLNHPNARTQIGPCRAKALWKHSAID